MREILREHDPSLRFRENVVFAWIPTITSVSRQAAFAGKPPIYFPASIHTTDKEPGLWTQFWVDQGLTQHEQEQCQEQYGERETVSRAVQRVLRSFIDWGVLSDAPSTGIYTAGLLLDVTQVKLIAWLIEALLYARGNRPIALKAALDSPSLFPFQMNPVSGEHLASVSGRLEVLRHGLDQDMILLRNCL